MLLENLQKHNLNIAYCRGQSHDNGSNMMGHKQGVQARIRQLNNKALCVPCISHTLNLVIADAAKSLVRSMSLFGVLQRLYTLFSSSMSHWAILKQHVKDKDKDKMGGKDPECKGSEVPDARDDTSTVCPERRCCGKKGL